MYQFKKHVVQEKDNQLVISLYLDIPNVEFAQELGKSKDNQEDLEESAKSYINSKFPNVKNASVKIMAGTMLIASLAFGATSLSPTKAAAAEATPTDNAVETATTNTEGTAATTENPATESEGTITNESENPATEGTVNDTEDTTTDTENAANEPEGAANETEDTATDTEGTPTTQKEILFNDTAGTYFTEPVEVLVDKGVVFGVTDNAFVPYRDVTRAEAAAMLARALNLDTEKDAGDPVFNDVTASSDFYGTISALKEAGVIEGYDDNTFKPNQTITRAELAKMIVSTFDNLETNPNATVPFTDVGDQSTFKNYIAAIHEAGITKGSTETTFDPYKNTRRAEAATMIYRSINVELFGKADGRVPIEAINETSVTVNGKAFTLSENMKGLLNQNNSEILTDAVVYLSTDKQNNVEKIRYLEMTNSGTEETPLTLDGGDTVINGPLVLKGDFLSINGVTVKGETIIEGTAAEVTSAAANTTASGGKITVDNSILSDVTIKRDNVNFETKDSTISKLTIKNTNTKVTLNENTKIDNLTIPTGSNPNDIIENYDSVKQNIKNIEEDSVDGTDDQTPTTVYEGEEAAPFVTTQNFNTHSGADYKGLNIGFRLTDELSIADLANVTVSLVSEDGTILATNTATDKLFELSADTKELSTAFITTNGTYQEEYWTTDGTLSKDAVPVKAVITLTDTSGNQYIVENENLIEANEVSYLDVFPDVFEGEDAATYITTQNFNTHSGTDYKGLNIGFTLTDELSIADLANVTVSLVSEDGTILATNTATDKLFELSNDTKELSTAFITINGTYQEEYWTTDGTLSKDAVPVKAVITLTDTSGNQYIVENEDLVEANGVTYEDTFDA